MTNLTNLTTGQLRDIIAIKEQIETLQSQLDSIAGGGEISTPSGQKGPKKGRRSAAVRARMAAAQRARWARIKGTGPADSKPAKKKKRKLSAAHRRKLIKALAKARKMRWAKMKATKATPKKGKRRLSAAGRAAISAAAKARWAKQRATTTTPEAA